MTSPWPTSIPGIRFDGPQDPKWRSSAEVLATRLSAKAPKDFVFDAVLRPVQGPRELDHVPGFLRCESESGWWSYVVIGNAIFALGEGAASTAEAFLSHARFPAQPLTWWILCELLTHFRVLPEGWYLSNPRLPGTAEEHYRRQYVPVPELSLTAQPASARLRIFRMRSFGDRSLQLEPKLSAAAPSSGPPGPSGPRGPGPSPSGGGATPQVMWRLQMDFAADARWQMSVLGQQYGSQGPYWTDEP